MPHSAKRIFFLFVFLCVYTTTTAQYVVHITGNDSCGYYGNGVFATTASIRGAYGACTDKAGNLYISEDNGSIGSGTTNHIRKITAATGIITTIAGGGTLADTLDNIQATSAFLFGMQGIGMDKAGNLYIAEDDHRVKKLNTTTGIITTVAGNAIYGYSGDSGPASAARLHNPRGIAIDTAGNVYVSDNGNGVIRKITVATGIINTVAGTGVIGYSGDGGPATAAKLNAPWGLYIDSANNLYITDGGNFRIRKVDAVTGIITTVAGSGGATFAGDGGPATMAKMYPSGITMDKAGNLYIADVGNYRMRKVAAATGIISTIAGSTSPIGLDSAGEGGPATAATVRPLSICIDTCGTIFFTNGICRVRAITQSLPVNGMVCNFRVTGNTAVPAVPVATGALQVFPDPCHGTFTLRLPPSVGEPAQIVITDIAGRRIKEQSVTAGTDTELTISSPPGMYFIAVTTLSSRWNSKIVIQ